MEISIEGLIVMSCRLLLIAALLVLFASISQPGGRNGPDFGVRVVPALAMPQLC